MILIIHIQKLQVAALVKSPDGDENWILAEVVSYNTSSAKYEVDDIDEEQKDRHTLSRRRVIPLPTMRASPETNSEALWSPGATVMAIYPQTTCFYKGVIKEQPSAAAGDYQVLFEDSSYADGYSPPLNVAQRYIIQVTLYMLHVTLYTIHLTLYTIHVTCNTTVTYPGDPAHGRGGGGGGGADRGQV